MSEIFLTIVNMSISASWLVFAVLLLRLVLKKAPKWVNVLLWGFVAFRLVFPISFESMLSLIPSAETVSPQIMTDPAPHISSGIYAVNSMVNPVLSESFAPALGESVNPLQIWIPVVATVWLAGVTLMLGYIAVSYYFLRQKVSTAVRLRDNIFQSEYVDSPFVLGIIRPKIYLPFQMDSENLSYVVAHECAHIRRKDHWWKPIGFLLLTVHWFNPLMWVGYIFLCRDIELACDEKVIKAMNNENRADYTQALVACSINRRSIAACPLAFGEVGVKERVKSVMNYRKPGFWIMVAAIVTCIVVAVCFLTNPNTSVDEKLSVFIDCQIADHYQTEKSEGNACCVNWEVLGKEKRGAVTTVYMWVLYEEYSLQQNQLHQETGFHIPTVITVKYEDGVYKLIEYWEPRDGSRHASDIREKFPWHLQQKALDPQRYIESQQAENRKMALEYFDSLPKGDQFLDSGPVETIHGNMKTYLKNADGTWQVDGRIYKYRLEISGQVKNSSNRSMATFVYLSNLEYISFDQAWDALFSSNCADWFFVEDAVLVDWLIDNEPAVVNPQNQLDALISSVILDYGKTDKPDGLINTESHIILAHEVVSGTPAVGQAAHIQEEAVFVYYLNMRFRMVDGKPEEYSSRFSQAIITFTVDENGGYILKDYLEPQYATDFDAALMNKFASAAENAVENAEEYNEQLRAGCLETVTDYLEKLKAQASTQPGGRTQIIPQSEYSPVIDSMIYDIDGDGMDEICTLTYGPTSGLFSFCFNVAPMEAAAAGTSYSETYVLMGVYNLSFDLAENGRLRIKGESTDESVFFDMTVKDGRIVLQCADEELLFDSTSDSNAFNEKAVADLRDFFFVATKS